MAPLAPPAAPMTCPLLPWNYQLYFVHLLSKILLYVLCNSFRIFPLAPSQKIIGISFPQQASSLRYLNNFVFSYVNF